MTPGTPPPFFFITRDRSCPKCPPRVHKAGQGSVKPFGSGSRPGCPVPFAVRVQRGGGGREQQVLRPAPPLSPPVERVGTRLGTCVRQVSRDQKDHWIQLRQTGGCSCFLLSCECDGSGYHLVAHGTVAPYQRPLSHTRPPHHKNSVGTCCVQRVAR
jgi:hypothetical protein